MHPDSHTQLPINSLRPFSFLFLPLSLFYEDVAFCFLQVFFVPLPFSHRMTSTSYVFPFRMVLFCPVTTGCWIFYISSCENSINQSKHIQRDGTDATLQTHLTRKRYSSADSGGKPCLMRSRTWSVTVAIIAIGAEGRNGPNAASQTCKVISTREVRRINMINMLVRH